MSYRVLLHPKATEFLKKCGAEPSRRNKQRLGELGDKPEEKGIRLKHSSFWRLRIGDYRAIYMIDEEERKVIALFIGHRREVYDDFSRLF